MRSFPIALLLCVLNAPDGRAGEPAAEPPQSVVGHLLSDGCDAHPDHVSSQFRSEGGCEGLSAFFATSDQRTKALVLGDRALVTRTIDRAAVTRDYYFHLWNVGGSWRLMAIRSLATPRFVLNSCLSGEPSAKSDDTMRLMCMSDAEIVEWFEARKGAYEALRAYLVENGFSGHTPAAARGDGKDGRSRLERLMELMEQAGVSSINGLAPGEAQKSAYEGGCNKGCLALTVTGIIDNTVGFIWSPARENLPELDPHWIIMLRPLGGGWWLFKTT